MTRSLAAVADRVAGRLIGADASFGVVSTDTRSLSAGSLFVAIRGDRFDGNDFVSEAKARGAIAALVSRHSDIALSQVEVADTRVAFGIMSRAWRENFSIPVVAVTGSAGKTTVKTMITSILSVGHRVCVTEGNLNNDIGVPLTLMRLDASDQALVVELGANHAGEIDYLASLAEPTVGVITNAGAAHLEGFGSVEGVAAAKGELLDHLPRAGTAVLNADDRFYAEWRARARSEFVVSFGLSEKADCRLLAAPALDAEASRFEMRLPSGERVEIQLALIGKANVVNALAAAAAATAVGASSDDVRKGLESMRPVLGRLAARRGRNGARIIDDSYNANPSAARAVLDLLEELPGRRIFVLGNMGELGPDSAELHAGVGRHARGRCDELYAYGELAAHAAHAFGPSARAFTDFDDLCRALEPELAHDVTVLIKGSRVMGLERLVAALAEPELKGTGAC